MAHLFAHQGQQPRIHPTAYVAPTATLCGDVIVGPNSRVLFGAVITAESGPVQIGAQCIIMEHAVVRGVARHPVHIGQHVLVGPHAHLSGCTVEDDVFIATGSSIFNGAVVGTRSVVRINGIVHVGSRLPASATVPIGWTAVGDPAEVLPPEAHERILALLAERGFSQTVFGLSPSRSMQQLTERYAHGLQSYAAAYPLDNA